MKEKYTIAIIDDEETAINNLTLSLKGVDSVIITGSAQNGESGKELILNTRPNLIFLDIEMPDMSGFDLLRDIKDMINWRMQVIFYTAYDSYLLKAIRESAFDYLLKPYTNFEFLIVINRFLKYMLDTEKEIDVKNEIDNFSSTNNTPLLISTIKGYRAVKTNEIGYFEYNKDKKRWIAVLEEKNISLKRNTSATDILDLAPIFIQINQQQIINITYLEAIEGKECKLCPPFNKSTSLSISRNYYNSVQERFLSI